MNNTTIYVKMCAKRVTLKCLAQRYHDRKDTDMLGKTLDRIIDLDHWIGEAKALSDMGPLEAGDTKLLRDLF